MAFSYIEKGATNNMCELKDFILCHGNIDITFQSLNLIILLKILIPFNIHNFIKLSILVSFQGKVFLYEKGTVFFWENVFEILFKGLTYFSINYCFLINLSICHFLYYVFCYISKALVKYYMSMQAWIKSFVGREYNFSYYL